MVDDAVAGVLARLLDVALRLPPSADPADHLPLQPWGELDDFRAQVYLPLHGKSGQAQILDGGLDISLQEDEAEAVRDTIDSLAESFSTGVPFLPLTESQRDAVSRVLSKLPSSPPADE